VLQIKTGYIQTDEGRVNTQYKSNKKQKMGTYAVNIYGWLMCKLTVPQGTIVFIAFVLRVDSTLICLYISSFYSMQNFVVYEINFEHLIGFSVFSNISSNWS
jgi:hypothetical protein